VFSSIKRRVCFCFHVLQGWVLRWIKPPMTSVVFGTLADLTKGKAELLAENALL
jgi:putative transposase